MRKLVPILVAFALAGAGFGSTYMGLWSPSALIASFSGEKKHDPQTAFVDVPPVEMSIPGSRLMLSLSVSLETDEAHKKDIAHQMPRVLDTFAVFLSNIDAAAYDKRGVVEIIRAELLSRTRQVLGEDAVKDLLITEFRIQ
ncbi:flagellar basal body-associated FliL family protein [Paracoccus sp. 11-3]|uniref:Flagellar protein FliL n=1 Tax=Paracoccus amoyensis TaxID=2760093 RepID=A0A926GDZ0_9RHOB|nr:flagellar basal body-associated FliL family protein [Paracoccus amoyensis]MBC9246766.1 flagellar basal body-associated FliL family protein [Paracoccus amoyensis]